MISLSKTKIQALELEIVRNLYARDTAQLLDNLGALMRAEGMIVIHSDMAKIPSAERAKPKV